MATKNKTKKMQMESKRTAGKKVTPMKKAVKKKLAKKKAAPKKAAVKTRAGDKKTTGGKTGGALKRQVRGKSQSVDTAAVALEEQGGRVDEQSGDLQGLSNVAGADSESVDELLVVRRHALACLREYRKLPLQPASISRSRRGRC
jgi:hypothetical protein